MGLMLRSTSFTGSLRNSEESTCFQAGSSGQFDVVLSRGRFRPFDIIAGRWCGLRHIMTSKQNIMTQVQEMA